MSSIQAFRRMALHLAFVLSALFMASNCSKGEGDKDGQDNGGGQGGMGGLGGAGQGGMGGLGGAGQGGETACPPVLWHGQDLCESSFDCVAEESVSNCQNHKRTVHYVCVEDQLPETPWWSNQSCVAVDSNSACSLIGKYKVTPTAPFEPADDCGTTWGGEFSLEITEDAPGLLYVNAKNVFPKPVGCDFYADWVVSYQAEIVGNQVFSTTVWRSVHLDFSQNPPLGKIEIECVGEGSCRCGAPAIATKIP